MSATEQAVTTLSPTPAAPPAPRTNVGAALRAETADLWPTDAPSEPVAPPVADPGDAAADAAPTRTAEPKATPEPKPKAADPAPETAPETVTLTATELATLRRQANDQSATAKELARVKRQLQLTEEARTASLGEIAKKWEGTEVHIAAQDEYLRGRNYVDNTLADDESQATAATQAQAALHGNKIAIVLPMMHAMREPLVAESAALGIGTAALNEVIEEVKKGDRDWQRFEQKFVSARTLDDARDYAETGYAILGERVMARLQDRKIASLKEPDDPKPKNERTHVFGGGQGMPDPDAHLSVSARAKKHAREGVQADMASIWQQEQ